MQNKNKEPLIKHIREVFKVNLEVMRKFHPDLSLSKLYKIIGVPFNLEELTYKQLTGVYSRLQKVK
jgi:hypothetical protein